MSAPARQPSFRERLHGIGLSWQNKKSESYSSKDSPHFQVSTSVKSHSVDSHVYSNPLDIGRLKTARDMNIPPNMIPPPVLASEPAPLIGSPEGDARTEPSENSPTEKKVLSRTLTQPKDTFEYAVSASDTLAGIAARFDTTPSELVKLNRLVSRLIFPGQTLYVPVKTARLYSPDSPKEKTARTSTDEKELVCGSPCSPRPGHAKRVESPTASDVFFANDDVDENHKQEPEQTKGTKAQEIDKECLERFLKINSKHITDGQGFVSGVLLVTPNALMFDPNVSDTLVIEHGVETYGVIAPMEMIMRAAIYLDIAHMRVKDAPENVLIDKNKPKIYCGATSPSELSEQLFFEERPCPDEEFEEEPKKKPPAIGSQAESGDLISFDDSCPTPPNSIIVSSSLVTEPSEDDSLDQPTLDSGGGSLEKLKDGMTTIVETQCDPEIQEDPATDAAAVDSMDGSQGGSLEVDDAANDKLSRSATVREGSRSTQSRRERMLKRLSYPVESISSYTQSSISKILSSSPRNLVDFSSGLFVRATETQKDDGPKKPEFENAVLGYKNMVEDKPDLFAAVDNLGFLFEEFELLPRPARQYESQPLYLCLRMGQPVSKKVQWSTPIASYSKKRMKKEYWFSIPRARVDDLYNFFQRWHPEIYGDVDEVAPEDLGFMPIESDQEEEEEVVDSVQPEVAADCRADDDSDSKKTKTRGPLSFLKLVEGHFAAEGASSPFDWELVSLSEAQKSPEIELPLPDLSEKSDIFTEEQRRELYRHLPARAEGYPWTLIYSSSKHGFSLKTMYREMAKYEGPVLLASLDTEETVFGALMSCSFKMSDHFYGTGESFLFTFHPEFKCYHWTGENMYFIKGNAESLGIGCGEGKFGLWLDGDLYHGRSQKCSTYGNETLSAQEDFVVKALEVWGFV